jgi:hypothetical protein
MEDEKQILDTQESSNGGLEEVIKCIDDLAFLDDLDKHWARKDAEQLMGTGTEAKDLKEKYQFYDHIAEIQRQILENLPSEKQEEVTNIIRQITSKPSSGQDREMKLEHVLRVKRTVDAFRENQITLQFLVQEKITSGDVHFGVAKILSEDVFKKVEKIFPDRFWKLSDRMSPNDFPHFTVAFNFALKESFVQGQSITKLKAFSEKIKTSLLEDGQDIVSEFFSEKVSARELQNLKKIPADKPAKLLGKILALRFQREKNEAEALKSFQHIQRLSTSKNPKAAKAEVDTLEKKFGKKVFPSLRKKGFIVKLEVVLLRIKELEKQLKSTKNPDVLKKLNKELSRFQQPEKVIIAVDSAEGNRKKVQDILQEIAQHKQQGNLSGAERSAQKLRPLDSERAEKEIAKIKSAQAKKDHPSEAQDVPEKSVESSEGKQKKVRFLEMLKEHAQKVMSECGQLGIPKDSEKYWGVDGVRNRMQYLKDNGLWGKYQQFNSSDRNMPSRTHEGGFRFRWVNLTTGTNLNTTSAQRGIEYLTQRKESGYAIAALGAAFSVNWKGHSSPVYNPERFISFVEQELSRVRGSK